MILGIYFLNDSLKDAFLVEDEGHAEGTHVGAAVELLLCPNTKYLLHFSGGVGQQGEWERVLLDEFCVGSGAVFAYSNHIVAGGNKGVIIVPQAAGLRCAARCVVFWVEVDDCLLPDEDEQSAFHREDYT